MSMAQTSGAVDWADVLSEVDWALFFTGWGVIVAVVLHWLIRVRRDPLAGVPDVPNTLLPEGVLLPMLVWLFVGALLGTLAQPSSGGTAPVVTGLWVGDAAQVAGIAACLAVATRYFQGGARRFLLGGERIIRDVTRAIPYLLASLAVCPLVVEITLRALMHIEPGYKVFEHEVVDALRTERAPAWMLWIGAAVIAPIAEECFFRGLLQTMLGNLLRSRWLAVLLTGLIFGVIHAGGRDAPQPHVVPAMAALGILLGVLYLRTGALVGPIALHALFNLKTLLFESLSLSAG